jgi:carbon-monoxide dehydrogenase medium subunit
VRIAPGALAAKPFRVKKAETVLAGKVIEEKLIWKAAVTAVNQCGSIADVRASAEYRLELVKELTFRAIKER